MTQDKQKVILVDDSATNLASGKSALAGSYIVYTLPSGEKLFKLLENVTPDLILLDVEMPDMDGYEVISRLKSEPRTADIPVIYLTARNDPHSELRGLSLGATDYIRKPFSPPLLKKRIELHLLVQSQRRELLQYNENLNAMVVEKTKTVIELQRAVFDLLAMVVEYRDDETGGHIDRTRRYVHILINGLLRQNIYFDEISSWDLQLVEMSSQLHDIGKVAIPDSILRKPGKLTAEEFEIMKKHAAYGTEMIERIEQSLSEQANVFIQHAKHMAGTHHEKWDGTGYPAGLSGESIPLEGRIMAVADVYDALISKRPYKAPMTHAQASDIILRGGGAHFDPALCAAFYEVADEMAEAGKQA